MIKVATSQRKVCTKIGRMSVYFKEVDNEDDDETIRGQEGISEC